MRGNKIAAWTVGVGFVLAFAALGQVKASAQEESEAYHDRWTKPFFNQVPWDQKKLEYQNMHWDVKVTEREMSKDDSKPSEHWHDRWYRPYGMQPSYDQQRWEDRNMRWDIKLNGPTDLSDAQESVVWHDRWYRPFNMQPVWDQGRWEAHCMNWGMDEDHESGYRHRETAGMKSGHE